MAQAEVADPGPGITEAPTEVIPEVEVAAVRGEAARQTQAGLKSPASDSHFFSLCLP